LIDQRLIAAAAAGVYFFPEPIERIGVDAQGDLCLVGGGGDDGTTFCLIEIIVHEGIVRAGGV
jgi:hypothetical protein